MQNREAMRRGLVELGFHVCTSSSNFLFARHPRVPAPEILSFLRRNRILVRHFPEGRTAGYLRITVGTVEECTRLLSVLEHVATAEPASIATRDGTAD
jgi:histidinol-phosphate aminotransferase